MNNSKSGVEEGTGTASKIRFSATLFRPAATARAVSWTFLTLPREASAKLPSRGQTTVEGVLNGLAFRATLEPDGQPLTRDGPCASSCDVVASRVKGQGGHWLKVDRKMREAARRAGRGAEFPGAGDVVTLQIAPVAEEPEPRVPADLRKARAAAIAPSSCLRASASAFFVPATRESVALSSAAWTSSNCLPISASVASLTAAD
jgi:hypothetical protein